MRYFNPRPPRGGRPTAALADYWATLISIHALREEGDSGPLCGYGRQLVFQSTPSARRATVFVAQLARGRGNFNPRPPRGGRHAERCDAPNRFKISIHALREEGDVYVELGTGIFAEFQSTPSARRATFCPHRHHLSCKYFNPRPPRGGRPALFSRLSFHFLISIHALREEGDQFCPHRHHLSCKYFNPRPPRGGRQKPPGNPNSQNIISIHALREEGDSKSGEKIHHVCSIIHTCAQFEKELYEGSGEMQNKSC